ncbi:MAG: cyclic pyranopterin monophosphate synthase MoaC [Candidatus Eremiobacteraeota bacterium]|nr:cyclic pyranopterin monophosphate synthase MoaC [Candidatus Eremiobacteraeota bacterium]
MPRPTHIASDGSLVMVDVGAKAPTERSAHARAAVRLTPAAANAVREATLAKGDVLVAAQLAGIMAAKQTANLIPLAHPIPLAGVDVEFSWEGDVLVIDARARTVAQTGVEMEAMTAAAVAALVVYDMTKAVEKGIEIEGIRLLSKSGGKSGSWKRRAAERS